MEALIRIRHNLEKRLGRAVDKIESHDNQPLEVYDVDILNEQLEKILYDFHELSDSTLVTCQTEEVDDQEDALTEISDRIYSARRRLKVLSSAFIRNSGENGGHDNPGRGTRNEMNVKLPKIDLKSFSGNLLEWTQFRQLFESSVHHQNLRGAVKMQYLLGVLTGEAAELVKGYQISDAGYEEVWNVLQKRYQNDRELVKVQITKFNEQPKLKEKNADGLRQLVDTSTACVLALKTLGRKVTVDDDNDWLSFGIMDRLDSDTRELWESKLGRNVMPKLGELLKFLDDRASVLVSSGGQSEQTGKKSVNDKKTVYAHQASIDNTCIVCKNGSHYLYHCKEFLKMTVPDRCNVAKEKHLCFHCLRSGHGVNECKWNGACKHCKKKHNSLLHIDFATKEVTATANPENEKSGVTAHTALNECSTSRALLATAIISILDRDGISQDFRALLDPGADVSFISGDAAQKLKLKRRSTETQITGVGSASMGKSTAVVNLMLRSSCDKGFAMTVNAFVLSKVTGILPKSEVADVEVRHLKNLVLADPGFNKPGRIDVLLGADVFFEIVREQRVTGLENQPIGIKTVWGFVVGGKFSSQSYPNSVSVHHVRTDDANLDEALRRFWETEECPRKQFYTPEEQDCEDHFVTTHTRNHEGRYVVRLPFRADAVPLGNSLDQAVRRLKLMEKQLASKPQLKQQYIQFMQEYLDLGHMERIPDAEIDIPDHKRYYFPHHPIIKNESSTTKVRVVFDGSAKTSTGISLNDTLMTGSKLQDDLFDILLRFRIYIIGEKADIAKMYRQILVNRKDVDYQRIVWREHPHEDIRYYRLLTETYGKNSAPFQAKRSLAQLIKDEAKRFPSAASVAKKKVYMDDLLAGAGTIGDAIGMQQEMIQILKSGGMDLRKWVSNSTEVLEAVPEEMRDVAVPLDIDDKGIVKTLGICWHPPYDMFKFKVTMPEKRRTVTKRTISSYIAKLYDPHGLLAPVTVCGKMMLQDMWKLECPWDAQVPDFILESWNNFREGLIDIESIHIPRCIQQNVKNEYYLLGFCDASMRAYSAVVYFGTLQNGVLRTSIIAAKTRPAPVKSKSLPRLELCGAVLLVRLLEAVKNAFAEKPLDIAAWTDSRIVLEWLKDHPGTWDTFVANRVAEVQESLPFQKWRHVRGVENPADCASRGISAKELVNHPSWWQGPSWLSLYPNLEVCEQVDLTDAEKLLLEAKRNVHAHHTVKDDFSFLQQYSSLPKLLYVTAYCRRFFYNCQAKKNKYARRSGPISVHEYQEALRFWIAKVQGSEFAEELKSLQKGNSCGSNSKLLCLNPFLDRNGLARVGGRLRKSKLPEFRKYPVLLPKNNPLTDMIINYEHQIQLHAGPQLLLACLQRQYWILGARDRIKYWVKKCVVCTRHRGEAMSQMMADLPSVRVNPVRPFLKVGVDYTGPVLLKEFGARSRKEFKGYVVIFVCMATRAIHLELARSLSSPAFIATLKRFMARRGKPCEMFSDCGRTFVGAAKELRFLHEREHLQSVSKYLTTECIKFQ